MILVSKQFKFLKIDLFRINLKIIIFKHLNMLNSNLVIIIILGFLTNFVVSEMQIPEGKCKI
jgi:hypothetical protein